MRLRDNKFAVLLMIYSIVGWPALVISYKSIPSVITQALTLSLLASLIVIPTIGFIQRAQARKNGQDNTLEEKRIRRIAVIYSVIFILVVGGYAFIVHYLPLAASAAAAF
jgi:hypothetical protein